MLNEATYKYLEKEGVEYLCFSGMENLLEEPCDRLLLGMIHTEKRKGGGKCVNPLYIGEQLPRYYNDVDSKRINLLSEHDIPCL